MKKIYTFLLLLLFGGAVVTAQTTLTTGVPSAITNFSGSPNFVLTFTVQNTNAYPVTITSIDAYRGTASNGTTYSLYYSATSLSGTASGWATNPAWIFITSTPISPATTNAIYPTFNNVNFIIPANTTYRFLQVTSGSAIVCGSTTATPNNWSGGGLTIGAGNYQINSANVGYAASGSSTPYFWAGTLYFQQTLPCTSPPNAGTAIVSNATPCPNTGLTLNLTGYSGAGSSGQTYQWESSLTPGGPFTTLSGVLSSPYYTTSATSSLYYRCAVTCGASTSYSTEVQTVIPALFPGGTYTIDGSQPPSATNFQSFAAAASAINCGTTGSITFNVAPGTYANDNFRLDAFVNGPGKTISINGNGATLSFVSTTAAEPSIVKLNGTKNVTIDNLNIVGVSTSTSNWAWAIHMTNNADSNTVTNCTITLDSTTTSTNYAGIVVNGGTTSALTGGAACDRLIFNNNTIRGGYYGMILFGASGTALQNNIVTNNVFRNYYFYGLYTSYTNLNLIDNNDFSRPSRTTAGTCYGIYLINGVTGVKVLRNRIHDPAPSAPTASMTVYGIALATISGTAANPNIFANNLIYNIQGGGTGIHYYLYNSSSAYAKFYHNTISSDFTASTGTGITYGYYQTGTTFTGIEFRNNNISITRGGTSAMYGIFLNTATATVTSSNNNFYVNSATGVNNVGYFAGAPQQSLANWQSASGQDATSVTVTPSFLNPAVGDFTPTNALLDNLGTPITAVTTDINNAPRNTTTPDIGAYEFFVSACSGGPTAGTVSAPMGVCSGASFTMNLTGFTIGSGIVLQWESSPAGANLWSNIGGATNPSYTTSLTASTDYRVTVTCTNSNISDVSNVVSVALNSFYYCYCSPLTGTPLHTNQNNYITKVTIPGSTLNNTTTAAGAGGYTQTNYLVPSNTGTLYQNTTYNLQVQISPAVPTYAAQAWIDYDQSGTFDAGEFIQLTTLGGVASASIPIPGTALTGLTGMRVRVTTAAGTYPASGACSSITTGYETEDYVITIGALPTCAIPTGLTVNATPTSATASWASMPSALDYEWAIDQTSTGDPDPLTTPVYSPNNSPFPQFGLTPSTVYYLHVRASCNTGYSPWMAASFTTPPPNDDCANAVNLSSGFGTAGSMVGATQTMASGTCAASTTYANDVWYYFSTNGTGNITVTASNTVGDVVLEVLSGTCGSFTQLDCQDGPAIGTETSVLSNLPAGTYYVRVYGYLSIQNAFIVQVSGSTLAIKLKDISATNAGKRNRIDWQTASEDKGDYFILERSSDGNEFTPLATIPAKEAASVYSYWDESPMSGVNYYRLKMKDIAGSTSYSEVVTATVFVSSAVRVYPNPVTDVLTVISNGTNTDNATLLISDVAGKVLKTINITGSKTEVTMSGLAPGVYFVKYMDNNHSETIKVNKQ